MKFDALYLLSTDTADHSQGTRETPSWTDNADARGPSMRHARFGARASRLREIDALYLLSTDTADDSQGIRETPPWTDNADSRRPTYGRVGGCYSCWLGWLEAVVVGVGVVGGCYSCWLGGWRQWW